MKDISYSRLQASSMIFIAVIGLGVILNITKSFMVPFVLAVLLSFLIVPIADYLERRRLPSLVINALIIVGIICALTALGFIFYGALYSIKGDLPYYSSKSKLLVNKISEFTMEYFNMPLVDKSQKGKIAPLLNLFSPAAIVKTLNLSVGTFLNFLSKMILMIVFLIFILVGRKVLIDKVLGFFHAREINPDGNFDLIRTISRQIRTYLWLKTVISIATGFVFGLVAFLLGLDFALIWGFLGFVLNFIPTLGPIMATIPPAILCFLQFPNPWYALLSALLLAFVQFLSGNIIEPKIMGDNLNLNIITILLSLFMWGIIWGIPGMLLAVPITAGINIVFANIPRLKEVSTLLSK